jgi:hypothetical protein
LAAKTSSEYSSWSERGTGNPQFLEIDETIVGGTGALAGATGSGSGEVKLHGCIAIGKTSGTLSLP